VSAKYKFLIVDPYYPEFLDTYYEEHPEAASAGYAESLSGLMAQCFGTADFYSRNLRSLGHQAEDVVANDELLQRKWAAETDVPMSAVPSVAARLAWRIPYVRRFTRNPDDWMLSLLLERVRLERPDVLFFHNIGLCEPWLIRQVRPLVRLIVGQIACIPPADRYLRGCDLILTSFPHYVKRFRAMGIDTEYFRLGFESTVLDRLERRSQGYDVSFIGGILDVHADATATLERVADEVNLDFWGYGEERLSPDSPLLRRFHGRAWGLEMYDILYNTRIAVNRHGAVSEAYANNMRLFEATGVGALLLTDHRDNLGEMFDVGKEIETYRDADELVEKTRFYLAHEPERAQIARAGQARTLSEHTFQRRMEELEAILEPRLRRRR